MNDWYRIQVGKPLDSYQNYINNNTEKGTNPRILESVYLTKGGSYYDFAKFIDDPITEEDIPYDIKGYADIMTGNYPAWLNQDDSLLGSDYPISINSELFTDFSSFKEKSFLGGHVIISPSYRQIKELIDNYGIVYAQLEELRDRKSVV